MRVMIRSLLLLLPVLSACQQQVDYDPGTPPAPGTSVADTPASGTAEILGVRVYEHEMQEGMRRVQVQLRVAEPPHEMTITEWVPVVLLGRLQRGASVNLALDPVEDRLTLSL